MEIQGKRMTYRVWIGGSCDYAHKERAGAAAVVIEQTEPLAREVDSSVNSGQPIRKKNVGTEKCEIVLRDVISGLHTTEFRMMLTLMAKVMQELPEGSDIVFLTNVAYLQNFDKTPTAKSANPDLVLQCIEEKRRHSSVQVNIVPYHKSPLLVQTHDMATDAMAETRKDFHRKQK